MSAKAPNFLHPAPSTFRWWALADFVSMILIMVTGGLVRLTGSGLGCPDWPQCYKHTTAHQWGIHSVVEFGNRLVTGILIVVTLVAFIMAITRRPRRRDLVITSGSLVLFVVLNAVLGAVVVYSHLNPWLVNCHMLVSLAMVVLGAVQYHRSKYVYGPGARVELRSPRLLFIARWLAVNLIIVLVVGTATTGSGPHAGNTVGQDVARRLPFALIDVAWCTPSSRSCSSGPSVACSCICSRVTRPPGFRWAFVDCSLLGHYKESWDSCNTSFTCRCG